MQPKKKKPAPKPAKKASTALAVRKASKPPKAAEVVISGLPAVPEGQLGDLPTVGAVGLIEIKLTTEEETALARPVNVTDILIKPDGVPYIPWAGYSRWFTSAFGRFGWSMVPAGQPKKADNLVLMPYKLFIHGQPVAMVWGEQEFYADNKRQSFGDAIESTRGSALRRFAKQFDIGLEMWDKVFLAQWKDEHCISVTVTRRDGKDKTEWRRKIDPPLPGEKSVGNSRRGGQPPPYAAVDADYDEDPGYARPVSSRLETLPVITPQQLGRLKAIAERMGRKPEEVTLYLKKNFKVPRAAKLLQKDYAKVCADLERRGDLPIEGDGGQ